MSLLNGVKVLLFSGVILASGLVLRAQPGQRDHQARGGAPGQNRMPPGQAKKYEAGPRNLPPGQAKKYFRTEDRDRYSGYYRQDMARWRARPRPVFIPGQLMARGYVLQPVPRTLWVGAAVPLPPGYQYGYYGGYVVAYNPTTRIIADVVDLIDALH